MAEIIEKINGRDDYVKREMEATWRNDYKTPISTMDAFREGLERGYNGGYDAAQQALATELASLRAEVEGLKAGLEHYADESNWDDPHPDQGYGVDTAYNFEDDLLGQVAGYHVAREVLREVQQQEDKQDGRG